MKVFRSTPVDELAIADAAGRLENRACRGLAGRFLDSCCLLDDNCELERNTRMVIVVSKISGGGTFDGI